MKIILLIIGILVYFGLTEALDFGDWSLKFLKNKKKLYNKFYDAKWAFYIMHKNRKHTPNIDSKTL